MTKSRRIFGRLVRELPILAKQSVQTDGMFPTAGALLVTPGTPSRRPQRWTHAREGDIMRIDRVSRLPLCPLWYSVIRFADAAGIRAAQVSPLHFIVAYRAPDVATL